MARTLPDKFDKKFAWRFLSKDQKADLLARRQAGDTSLGAAPGHVPYWPVVEEGMESASVKPKRYYEKTRDEARLMVRNSINSGLFTASAGKG